MPALAAGEGFEERFYDLNLREEHLSKRSEVVKNYLENVLEIAKAKNLTSHRARPHSDRDLRDFARLREGETGDAAIARGEKMEFPYDRNVFLDRYTRQNREGLCSTIVAHLAKDGLMFIHPTQIRSLTPREAARVQTFPDWFTFPIARTHQFRVIGNAVPPLVAEAVGQEIKDFLNGTSQNHFEINDSRNRTLKLFDRPITRASAALELQSISKLDKRELRQLATEDFLRGWRALIFLFPNLHPDSALDHGQEKEKIDPNQLSLHGWAEPPLERYVRSGWPVALALIGEEAWRRFRQGELSQLEFYCVEAQRIGLRDGNGIQGKGVPR